MSNWQDFQSLLQLAVTLNLGFSIVLDFQEDRVEKERLLLASIRSNLEKKLVPPEGGKLPLYVQKALQLDLELNGIFLHYDEFVAKYNGKYFKYIFFTLSIVSFAMLCVSSFQSGQPIENWSYVCVALAVPVYLAAAAVAVVENHYLGRAQRKREELVKTLSDR